jgi:multiple sugar transport system permease protein
MSIGFIHVRPRRVVTYFAAVLVFAWIALPIGWLVNSSINPEQDLLRTPPSFLPVHPTLNYYVWMFTGGGSGTGQEHQIPRSLLNSILIATSVMVINLSVAAPAAYALARFRFAYREAIVNGLLASRMVPSLALLVPFYLLFRTVGLTDSLLGMIVAHTAISVPFTIWILRGHFDRIPIEIEKAARVDGCSRLQVFRHVALPLAVPGLVVAGLFAFMLSWNEFALALVLTASPDAMPVQPTLAGLYSYQGVSYGFLFAGAVLAAIPPAIIAFVLQRHLTHGLLEGSVK